MNQALKVGGIVAIALVLVAGGLLIGMAVSGGFSRDQAQVAPYAYGPGMMDGGFGPGVGVEVEPGFGRGRGQGPGGMTGGYGLGEGEGYGPGMMGGFGFGAGMMGGFVPDESLVPDAGETLTLDEAVEVAEAYIASYGDDDLELAEVMQFSNHFYAQARETSTGTNAFEFLIDPRTAAAHPEPGPNMMWNAEYGHMGGGRGRGMMGDFGGTASGEMTVSPAEALEFAQAYLDEALPGTTADDAEAFYGYYTLHVLEDGDIVGMLSVHGSTGEVWYHTWHGEFVDIVGHHD